MCYFSFSRKVTLFLLESFRFDLGSVLFFDWCLVSFGFTWWHLVVYILLNATFFLVIYKPLDIVILINIHRYLPNVIEEEIIIIKVTKYNKLTRNTDGWTNSSSSLGFLFSNNTYIYYLICLSSKQQKSYITIYTTSKNYYIS